MKIIVQSTIVLFTTVLLSTSCDNMSQKSKNEPKSEQNKPETALTKEKLPELVKGAINPHFEDWVLFENGTYIIFDNADTIVDIEKTATEMMIHYGPVHAGGPAGDFGVSHLTEVPGWSVSGHGYGMYTYVHPSELTSHPTDSDIGLYGRNKRDQDGKKPVITHVNRKSK